MTGNTSWRTADRLIEQLIHIQRTHGELWGIVVYEAPNSSWCDPPIPKDKAAHFSFDTTSGLKTCHVWCEASPFTDSMNHFGRLCPALGDLAIQSRDRFPSSLQDWTPTSTDDHVLSWLWFIGGFAVTELSGRTPRSKRTCWGSGGHSFDAERLESLRASLPAAIVAHMPPDAGNWLIRIDNVIQTSIEAVEYIANIRPATESAGPKSHFSGNEVRRPKMEGMAGERQQQIVDLWNELKMAYDKAIQRFQNRLEDIETVFSVTNAMRASLIELDGIATQTAEYGEYSIELVDRLHTAIWKDRELFDSLSDQKRALFTWRETSIEWRGRQASNILEAIRNEAFQYGVDLQECSLHKTFAPSEQMRALYPERWFDVAGVAKVARRIKDRIPLATTSPEKLAPTLESTFGQYFAHIRGYEAAKNHVKRCSSNVTGPALKDTLSAFYVIEAGRWRQDANRDWNAAKALPNSGRVQALCEAEFGVLNSEGLRRLRGRLATVRQCGTEEIDSMTLNEFAESWQALILNLGTPQSAFEVRGGSSVSPEQAIVDSSLELPGDLETKTTPTSSVPQDNGQTLLNESDFTEPLPKEFLCHVFGDCDAKTLPARLKEYRVTTHPDDALPNRKKKLRLKIQSLIDTEIFLVEKRSNRLAQWRLRKRKRET